MIKCEGYKAFHGRATIRPMNPKFPPFEVSGDWLYKPEYDCWYCRGSSYPAEIVTDIVEESLPSDVIEELEARLDALDGILVAGDIHQQIDQIVLNTRAWIAAVKVKM